MKAKGLKLQCPCGSTRPMFKLFELHSFYLKDGVLTPVVEGYRVACNECPNVFSVDTTGRWKHNPKSLPYPAEPSYQQEEPQADDGARQPDRPLPPLPLRAPRL